MKLAVILLALSAATNAQVYDECINSDTFTVYHDGKDMNCKKIGFLEDRRQEICRQKIVHENCPISCGSCCEDDPDFTFEMKGSGQEQSCKWIDKNTANVDTRRSKYCSGKIKHACVRACDFCKTLAPFIETPAPNTPAPTTAPPTQAPTPTAELTPEPSSMPSGLPSKSPSSKPSKSPTGAPSKKPSKSPSRKPSKAPSGKPSLKPSRAPSSKPSPSPSNSPSLSPSKAPSTKPSSKPSRLPSASPSKQPSSKPSKKPSLQPSGHPSKQPSSKPSKKPSDAPTKKPSKSPSRTPSRPPSPQPSLTPSKSPKPTSNTPAPTPIPCVDDSTFTFVRKSGGKKKCKWLRYVHRQLRYCGVEEIKTACRKSCGNCN